MGSDVNVTLKNVKNRVSNTDCEEEINTRLCVLQWFKNHGLLVIYTTTSMEVHGITARIHGEDLNQRFERNTVKVNTKH